MIALKIIIWDFCFLGKNMNKIRDGDFYKRIEIEGVIFDVYYGYESDLERKRGWEPTPQYPDFTLTPKHTSKGKPFTVAYGCPCDYYTPIDKDLDDEWCANCVHFDKREEFIGLCNAPKRQMRKNE